MKFWAGSNLSSMNQWAEKSQNHRTKKENLDEHDFSVTISEFWVCVKCLKHMLVDNILKNTWFYVCLFFFENK